jgi:hypothetical protein
MQGFYIDRAEELDIIGFLKYKRRMEVELD